MKNQVMSFQFLMLHFVCIHSALKSVYTSLVKLLPLLTTADSALLDVNTLELSFMLIDIGTNVGDPVVLEHMA